MQHAADFRRRIPDDATIGSWTAPDGWALRRFDWPATTPRGHLLFQGGRGDTFEKYLETLAHLHGQGWSVTSFDWRGQGGSGRLSANARVGHADDFGVFVDDLSAFWRDWSIGRDEPCVVIGHSMGGYLILRALLDGVIDPTAAILVAPMLGLKSPVGARWGGRIARFMRRLGAPERAAWGGNERPASIATRQNLLTHDTTRYADEQWWYAQKPETRLGPPSWAWVAESFAATATMADDPGLAAMTTPLLMLVADADALVDPHAAIRVARRLPDAALVRFGPGTAHEILREVDSVRDRALIVIDDFLASRAPLQ